MQECTFSPRIQVSNLRNKYNKKEGSRSKKEFYHA